jgi:hypothetical protein
MLRRKSLSAGIQHVYRHQLSTVLLVVSEHAAHCLTFLQLDTTAG